MSDVIGACSIGGLDSLKKEHAEKGMLLFVSRENCGGCSEMRGLLKENIGERLPVIEAGVEDDSCLNVAKELGVSITPTVIFYRGGVEVKRVEVDGVKTQDNLRQELRELLA